jgi:carbon monoxide dehydrogenase subunit G
LSFVAQEEDMHKVSHTLDINASPDTVWEYLAEPTNFPEFSSTCQSSSHNGDGPIQVGSTITEVRNLLGVHMPSTYEVTEIVDSSFPKSFSTRVVEGPVPFAFKWTLDRVGSGTRLTGEGQGEWTDDHEDPVVEAAAQKNLEHDMETLKTLLETR